MSDTKSAYDLKMEAYELLRKAEMLLIDADGMLGHISSGAAFLNQKSVEVANIANELRATCTQCGKRPTDYGNCHCSLD